MAEATVSSLNQRSRHHSSGGQKSPKYCLSEVIASQPHIQASLGIVGEMSEQILLELVESISVEEWNKKLNNIFSRVSHLN